MVNKKMNKLAKQMEDVAEAVIKKVEASKIKSEDDTREVLVLPFIEDVLKYNGRNSDHIQRQYSVAGGRVDIALMCDNQPIIFIEVKSVGTSLGQDVINQLSDYFNDCKSVDFAICTNGTKYIFYTDLIKSGKMDSYPFLEFNLENVEDLLDDHDRLSLIEQLVNGRLKPDTIKETKELAYNLKCVQLIKTGVDIILQSQPDKIRSLLKKRKVKEAKTSDEENNINQLSVYLPKSVKNDVYDKYTQQAIKLLFKDAVKKGVKNRLNAADNQAIDEQQQDDAVNNQAVNMQVANNQAFGEHQSEEEASAEKFNLGDDNTDWEALIKNNYFKGYKALTLSLDGKEIRLHGNQREIRNSFQLLGREICKYYASYSKPFNYVTSNIKTYFKNESDLKNDSKVKYD